MLRLLVPHQGSALAVLGGLQHSEDPLLISSCLQHEKRHSASYKLNLEHKNSGMTKCLEKPLKWYRKDALRLISQAILNKDSQGVSKNK